MSSTEYSALRFIEIHSIARQNGLTLPRFVVARKEILLSYIAENGTSDLIATLTNRAWEKSVVSSRKHVLDDDDEGRNVQP